ncbi:YitT family protein [Lachnospiraceae bacterium OttesenSCG-928-D06]|nr:YitT family protein [Lachnospiraceae bacterium OttesenSCG-928-D06]
MKAMKRNRNRDFFVEEGKKTLLSIVGAFLYAVGINLFVVPAGLYNGGVMGICQIIRTLLQDYMNLPLQNFDIAGVIYYIVNLPIFFIAFTRIGKRFFLKTVVTVTAMTVFLAVLPTVCVINDTMAACVVGGIISGAGVGIILRMGSSGGGTDVIGVLVTMWKRDFSVGKINLVVNFVLYLACLFLFDIEIVIYSIIYAAVYAVAMDRGHSQNIIVEANIITKIQSPEMEKEIFEEIGRGITKWQCLGAYTSETSHILYILLSKYEVHQLKNIIRKYDPEAFMVINEGVRVNGNYLKKI